MDPSRCNHAELTPFILANDRAAGARERVDAVAVATRECAEAVKFIFETPAGAVERAPHQRRVHEVVATNRHWPH